MTRVKAELQIPFDDSDLTGVGGNRLFLVLDSTFGTFGIGIRRLRLYPGVQQAKVVTNIGTVTKGGVHVQAIEKEVIQFSGGTTASTAFPIVNLVGSIETFGGGSIFDREGNTINPTFTVENGQVVSSEPTFGAVQLSYQTTYLQLDYEGDITIVTGGVGTGVGAAAQLGTVLAFFNGSVATLELTPADFPGDEGTELYKVISEAVIQEDTLFELPVGWTGQPGSPTHSNGLPDHTISSITVERVHEQGFITNRNSVFTRTQFVAVEQPGKGAGFFAQVKHLNISTVGENQLSQEQLDSTQAQTALDSAKTRYKTVPED